MPVCVYFARGSCKNYIALVCHTEWRNLYKNSRFDYFDGTNPITGKGVSYSILQRFWVMLVS